MAKKPRIHPYITQDNYVRLRALGKCPGRYESEIVDKALAAFFSNEVDDKRDAALIRRLDRMTRQMEGLKRKQIINAEAFALYVRYFLTVIPAVPNQDKDAARSQGAVRFENYLQSLKRVLEDGERVLFTALEDVVVDESAYFTKEELMRMHIPQPKKNADRKSQKAEVENV
ncbi:MAG: CopG family transcriptional regulator [Alphaproteobacteria bacterium]|nr:MAG: CopG family transcriptional regulator [Alphaproteobacteria bacterium]